MRVRLGMVVVVLALGAGAVPAHAGLLAGATQAPSVACDPGDPETLETYACGGSATAGGVTVSADCREERQAFDPSTPSPWSYEETDGCAVAAAGADVTVDRCHEEGEFGPDHPSSSTTTCTTGAGDVAYRCDSEGSGSGGMHPSQFSSETCGTSLGAGDATASTSCTYESGYSWNPWGEDSGFERTDCTTGAAAGDAAVTCTGEPLVQVQAFDARGTPESLIDDDPNAPACG